MAGLDKQLYQAATAGDLPRLRAALAAGADPNSLHRDNLVQLDSALHAATYADSIECVAALLAAGADADPPTATYTPLHHAVVTYRLDCLELLLAAGADPNGCGICNTPLADTVNLQLDIAVDALLAAGASASAANGSGLSATHVAATRGHSAILRRLLAAQPESAVARGGIHRCTPLGCAVESRRLGCAQILLELGTQLPTSQVLAELSAGGAWAQPLYATLVARTALTPAEWSRVPAPCTGLAGALPVVLQRSAVEALLLVRHLPPTKRSCLRCAALSLAGAQRRYRVLLPTTIA